MVNKMLIHHSSSDPELLPGANLCFMVGDTGRPETSDAMKRMTEMKDSGVDAFVGLEHSCAQEAFLAAAWDVPLISYVSFYCSLLSPLIFSLI